MPFETISASSFGNSASIFTSSGAAARQFRYQVPTGNRDTIEFYTDKKVVIERWPKHLSRQF